jgi:2-dehydro-3-deoxygalactonokinase
MMERKSNNPGEPVPPGKQGLFLSGDWGTSSLRIRLVDGATGQVIGEDRSGNGIRQTFFSWEQASGGGNRSVRDNAAGWGDTTGEGRASGQGNGNDDPRNRISFYLGIVRGVLRNMEDKLGLSLQGIPLVLSGMASSSAGMLELPYREIPFNLYGDDLITEWLPAGDAGREMDNPVLLISGLRSGDDVMRGEETQLMGCLPGAGWARWAGWVDAEDSQAARADGLYIFPGTHSKHILVKEGVITAFTTYMTGEIFELLSEKSLLKGSVEKSQERPDERHWASFRQGVKAAAGANFLQAAFRTRVNDLFGNLSRPENFYYLSGLLIGTELQSLSGCDAAVLYLCCGHGLEDHYEKALEAAAICKRVHIFPAGWVDKAAIRGQWAILSGIKPV